MKWLRGFKQRKAATKAADRKLKRAERKLEETLRREPEIRVAQQNLERLIEAALRGRNA